MDHARFLKYRRHLLAAVIVIGRGAALLGDGMS